MSDSINATSSEEEPDYIVQIRRHKEDIAAQIGPMLDEGNALENLAVYLSDGKDRGGVMFTAQHPDCTEPLVAVFTMNEMAYIADFVEPGFWRYFKKPAPQGHIRVLSCAAGKAYPVLLRCFPEGMGSA